MPKRNIKYKTILQLIRLVIYDYPPRLIDIPVWSERHKKIAGVEFSNQFLEYIREKEKLERRFKRMGITWEKFKKTFFKTIREYPYSYLVIAYLKRENYAYIGKEYGLSPAQVKKRIEKFFDLFTRALFL